MQGLFYLLLTKELINMKTKYSSNRELIHIWANDFNADIWQMANSVTCQHGKLYSYSTVIGQIVNNDTVIYNTASYSNTTSKHQGLMYQSSSHYLNRIYLSIHKYNLNNLVFGQNDFDSLVLKPNLDIASEYLLKASRSKKYKDFYNMKALSIFDNLEKYALLFNLVCTLPNTDAFLETIIKADKEAKAIEKIQKAERIQQQAEALQNWRLGLDVRNHFEITALRIKDDVIETSRGAKIPLEHAIKFWGLINSWHQKGTTYKKDHHSIHLGNYAVNRFENDILTVGCHEIPFSEIEGIANQLHLQG
jgi:hypothetical protein